MLVWLCLKQMCVISMCDISYRYVVLEASTLLHASITHHIILRQSNKHQTHHDASSIIIHDHTHIYQILLHSNTTKRNDQLKETGPLLTLLITGKPIYYHYSTLILPPCFCHNSNSTDCQDPSPKLSSKTQTPKSHLIPEISPDSSPLS